MTLCKRCGAIGHWEEDCTHNLSEAERRDLPPQRAKEKVVGSSEENLMVRDEVLRTIRLWRSTMMVRKLKRHI